jgi:hypothetical protein
LLTICDPDVSSRPWNSWCLQKLQGWLGSLSGPTAYRWSCRNYGLIMLNAGTDWNVKMESNLSCSPLLLLAMRLKYHEQTLISHFHASSLTIRMQASYKVLDQYGHFQRNGITGRIVRFNLDHVSA